MILLINSYEQGNVERGEKELQALRDVENKSFRKLFMRN